MSRQLPPRELPNKTIARGSTGDMGQSAPNHSDGGQVASRDHDQVGANVHPIRQYGSTAGDHTVRFVFKGNVGAPSRWKNCDVVKPMR